MRAGWNTRNLGGVSLLEHAREERGPAGNTADANSQVDEVERVLAERPLALEIGRLEPEVSWDPGFQGEGLVSGTSLQSPEAAYHFG